MKYKLCDICSVITDYVANGSFKSLADNVQYLNEKDYARLIRLVDYGNNYDTKDAIWVSKQSYDFLQKTKLTGGEIIISNVGANLGTVFLCPNLDYAMTLGPNCIMIKTNEMICEQQFLYYYLASRNGHSALMSIVTGSAMPKFNKTDLRNLIIDLPNLEIQKKIARILSALDQKIELNNQQSKALETVAFALYDDLINNIDESDFKKIAIGQIADCKLGGTPSRAKTEYWGGSINWVNSGAINSFRITEPSELITEEGFKHTSTYMLPKGTTVLAITGATLGQVSRMEIEGCANQSVIGIVGNNAISNEYIYLTIVRNIQEIINRQTGGAQQHINKNDIKEFEIILPNQQLMRGFTNKVKPIFEKIAENEFENKTLSSLRDNILPKLMSGEIDLENSIAQTDKVHKLLAT